MRWIEADCLRIGNIVDARYGTARFFIEFFRMPDAHLGRVDLFGMSRGQTLCSLMILTGLVWLIVLLVREKKAKKTPTANS